MKVESSLFSWLVVTFSLFYLVTSFFALNTVVLHTIYGLFIIAISCGLIHMAKLPIIKPILYSFWIGQALLYVINLFLYHEDVMTWLENFNNFSVMLPIYVVSFIIGSTMSSLKIK